MRVIVALMLCVLFSSPLKAQPTQQDVEAIDRASQQVLEFFQSAQYDQARALAEETLKTAKRVLGPDHASTLACINNLAAIYQKQQRYALALSLYQRVLDKKEQGFGKDHPDTLATVNNLATLYQDMGQFVKAEPLFKRVLLSSERQFGKNHPDTLGSLNNLAGLYQSLERYELAEPLYKRAVKAYQHVLGKEHPDTLKSLNDLASLYYNLERYELAETYYKKALKGYERNLGPNHPDTLRSVNNLAGLYENLERYDLAKSYYKRALKGLEKRLGKDHPNTLATVNNLALFYADEYEFDLAETFFKRVITSNERVLGKTHPRTLISANNFAIYHFDLGNWQVAESILDETTTTFSERSKRFGTQSLTVQQKSISQRNLYIYKIYLKAAYQLAKQNKTKQTLLARKTFTRLQWTQGLGVSQALSQMAARFGARNDGLARLIRERQDLVQDWKQQDEQLFKALGLPKAQRKAVNERNIRKRLNLTEQRLTKIDAVLKTNFPDYAAIANSEPLDIEQVQAELRDDEALIYFVDTQEREETPEETFIWVVTKEALKWLRSPLGTKPLEQAVMRLRCGLDGGNWMDKTKAATCQKLIKSEYDRSHYRRGRPLPFDTALAHKLYQELLAPANSLIKNKKLILVPSGPLTSLPFQVLISDQPKPGASLKEMAWLIKDHDLTVLPSVSSLRALRRNAKVSQARTPFIGFGNPLLLGQNGQDKRAFQVKPCQFNTKLASNQHQVPQLTLRGGLTQFYRGGQANIQQLRYMSPLPETASELCAVAKALKGKSEAIKLGEQATETTIKQLSKQGALKNARIIHFATHGLLAGETEQLLKARAEPALVMTPPKQNKANKYDDGLLTASEVTQLKLDADWVILSACNTAGGEKPGAEPMSGLAKAFFYAGARALLVSHWYVESKATVTLITSSINAQNQNKFLGRAGALRAGMIKMLANDSTAHPSLWAPFVLIGEGAKTSSN